MNAIEHTSGDISTKGGGQSPPSIGLTPDALPKVQKPALAMDSQTGVSTRNALSQTLSKATDSTRGEKHWYALRTTYGREKKAYEYLISKNVEAFYPTFTSIKLIGGKRKTITSSRLPNIFFAYGTEEEIKSYVYDNVNLPYLRFYYRHIHEGVRIIQEPLIVPDEQIENLKIVCASESNDLIIVPTGNPKFLSGQKVRVVEGCFKGVIGHVARFCGQQRVAIEIDGMYSLVTAYVPSAFLENY